MGLMGDFRLTAQGQVGKLSAWSQVGADPAYTGKGLSNRKTKEILRDSSVRIAATVHGVW